MCIPKKNHTFTVDVKQTKKRTVTVTSKLRQREMKNKKKISTIQFSYYLLKNVYCFNNVQSPIKMHDKCTYVHI